MSFQGNWLGGSNGQLGASPILEQGSPQGLINEVVQVFFRETDEVTRDEEHKEYLACPFWKHNPDRYLHVKSACTEGVGFKDLGKLTEHIKRVHCLSFGCERCRKRFNTCKVKEVDEVKCKHMMACKKAEIKLTDSDAEWMDEAQDAEYRQLNFQKDKGPPNQCYGKICRALWGRNYQNAIAEPYHLPGFQPSVIRWRFTNKVKQLLDKVNSEAYQEATQVPATPAPVFFNQNVDPMLLSRQTLHNLSTGPEPFFRAQPRKDSGVWSSDRTSEIQPSYAKPVLPAFSYSDEVDEGEDYEEGDDDDEDGPTLVSMDSDYNKTGAWTNPTDPSSIHSMEFDKDVMDMTSG
ncbi:hypothetical protein F4677DRAFT_445234 [Hypoxylon crocopeplum]|nr:hypothetical protein F4677DRAFT_445234 [Hypoxylon crocopeplum]